MSRFQEVNFEPPGHPIYKAFIVPCRWHGKLHDVIEVGAEEVDSWRKMLENLRAFLSNAMRLLSESGRNLEDSGRLELIGDLISMFLRAPLNREVLPGVAPSPLKAYLLMRLIGFENFFRGEPSQSELDLLEFTQEFYDKRVKKYNWHQVANIVREIEGPENAELMELCWLIFPADTRPILNATGLIPHLLLTSALAWAMAINRGIEDRRSIARLRLAALLHDVGKPFRYEGHERVSAEVAERLLNNLLPKKEVEEIKSLIQEHCKPKTHLGEIIKDANRLALATDALKKLLEYKYFKDIKNKLKETAELLGYDDLEKAFDEQGFWNKIHEHDKDIIKSLSEEFVRAARKITSNFTLLPLEIESDEAGGKVRDIRVVLVDVGRIQSFIYRSRNLKQVAAASLVVDSLIMAYMVAYLQLMLSGKTWLPYENFLYTAGGNVELLIPYTLVKEVEDGILNLERNLVLRYGIPLYSANAELYENYAKTVRELLERMSISKMSVGWREYPIKVHPAAKAGVREVCQFCFMEPPEERVQTPEGELSACKTCSKLYYIGLSINFKEKYESPFSILGANYSPQGVFDIPWGGENVDIRASECIMEIIAGHDLEELRGLGRLVRMRNIAVIKVDGTLMGLFMATCFSIADAYERSARIDLALKKSIEAAVNAIYSGVLKTFGDVDAARAALSIIMGIIYAGGDDAIMLVPSWASPLIALVLGKEFLYNLGCVRGLSIGVAAASPKANIWALVDAASELMHIAKRRNREKVKDGLIESAICFDVVESGDLSSSTINERFETLKRMRLTAQPFTLESFERALCDILSSRPEYSEIACWSYLASRNAEILERAAGRAGEELIESIRSAQRRIKEIRNAISEVLQAAKSMIIKGEHVKCDERYIFPIAYIYAARQISRVEEYSKPIYEFVNSLIPGDLDSPSSLSDVDRLIKIIGGGII